MSRKHWYDRVARLTLNQSCESNGMIRVLVRNQNGIDTSEIFADGRKSLGDFPAAQARVNQQSRFTRPNERRVSRAAARQYANFDDKTVPLNQTSNNGLQTASAFPPFLSVISEFPNNFFKIVFLGPSRMEVRMKARVYVSIKPTVLDPQGQTICSALIGLGHKEITSVRQAKYFEIALADGTPRAHATKMLDEIGRDVLSNPVIEDYRVEILD